MTSSPPTARVLDIIEFLADSGGRRVRLSELSEALGLSLGTAHNVLSTLTERGWVDRDETDKTFSLGPGLDVVASKTQSVRSVVGRARRVCAELGAEFGCATSIVERSGGDLVIVSFDSRDVGKLGAAAGDTFPYAPPFGVAFAAWADDSEQAAWVQRGAGDNPELGERLRESLDATRRRGYEVDRTTPALAQAAQLMGSLDESQLPTQIRELRGRLAEVAALGALPAADAKGSFEVYSIVAPVFDDRGRVRINMSLHPFRRLTDREVDRMGRRLVAAASRISRLGVRRVESQ